MSEVTKLDSEDSGESGSVADVSDASLNEYVEKLLYKMYLTKGARYQAARRHQRRAIASIWSVIFLSMYVFSTTTILTILDFSTFPDVRENLTIASVVMSAFIIAFSVLEHGKRHDAKAEAFLRCGQRLHELRDKLELNTFEELDVDAVRGYVEDYNEIINDFTGNHSETDFRSFRVNVGKHKGQYIYSFSQKFQYWLDCWAIMIVAFVAPPVSILTIIFWPV